MTKQEELIDVDDIQEVFIERDREQEEFECLVDSIKKIGLIIPITVLKKGSKYELIKGQGRLEAHKKLGLKKIKAYVYDGKIPDEEKISNWLVENVVRQHLSPFDRARMIYYEFQKSKDTDVVAQRFGIKRNKVQDAIDFLEKASPVILQKIENKELSFTPAKKIVATVEDKVTQNSVAEILTKENLDKKSEEVIIRRAAALEEKKKQKGEKEPKVSVSDLRRDIRYLKEDVQNKKDILATYENIWELGKSAINKLDDDKNFVNLLRKHELELLKED